MQESSVAVQERESLTAFLQRFRNTPCGTNGEACSFAPVHGDAMYRALLHEAAAIALSQKECSLLVLSDARALAPLDNAEVLLAKAAKTVVLWNGADTSVEGQPGAPECVLIPQVNDHLFLFFSPDMGVALFARESPEKVGEGLPCVGAWTAQRSVVLRLAEALVGPEILSTVALAAPDTPALERISAELMRLITIASDMAQLSDGDLFSGRSELLTVLEILKAIGSKRHTHDILFVFVEQVARIVETARCSIVRVWEGSDYAHVLASHEAPSLSDRKISLDKYPEICQAIDTGAKVVIDNVHEDPLTASLGEHFTKAGFDALAIVPVMKKNQQAGTLLLRAARQGRAFSPREINFFEVVAEAASSALEKAQLIESAQLANARLEHLAITDALTGLYNRRHLLERLEQELERSARYALPLSLLILDVDNFKQVNDTAGHLTGDAVLRGISARMQACVRRVDLVARFGGEEFVIILPQTGGGGAVTEAERIRAAIGEKPVETRTGEVSVTASIGIAVFDANWMRTTNDLIGSADEALRKAKQLGKNRVVLADNREGKT